MEFDNKASHKKVVINNVNKADPVFRFITYVKSKSKNFQLLCLSSAMIIKLLYLTIRF